MSVRDLIPWGRSNNRVPSVYRDDDRSPFLSLHREMNRMFDEFSISTCVCQWRLAASGHTLMSSRPMRK
jgi:hypothetical protein